MLSDRPPDTAPLTRHAVIYCRVSSTTQLSRGDGLGSQETRCRDYARHKGYEVAEIFRDEGVSGGMIDRPGMQAMLKFLRKHKSRHQHIVIIDDISRLARGIEAHIRLRTEITAAGGKLESPSIEFGEDSDSMLVENLLACVSQHQRQKNAEQVINRMRARLMNGDWVFQAPIGYRYKKSSGHGKILVRDEPLASILQDALEGFASGRFASQMELKRHLEGIPELASRFSGLIHIQKIRELLERPLYAGYMDAPKWGLTLLPGKHEPLISFETYERIQERLKKPTIGAVRKDTRPDFPLRGIVACASCGGAMTACWSKGRSKRYAYYFCQTKGCPDRRRNIRKERIEGGFEDLLESLRPNRLVLAAFRAMLRKAFEKRQARSAQRLEAIRAELATVERKSGQFMERLTNADSPALIAAYEDQIQALHAKKIALQERLNKPAAPMASFDESYRTALAFLANPCELWNSEALEGRRLVPRLLFGGKLPYCRNRGYRTAETPLPIKVLQEISEGNSGLVEPRGIEPLTSAVRLLRSPN